MNILGISAFYHDSAACLVRDGDIVAAAQEERFTRKKHDFSFPLNAIDYCLEAGKIKSESLDFIAFYDKPFVKFERILETYLAFAPHGIQSFVMAIPLWIKQKLWMKEFIKKQARGTNSRKPGARPSWRRVPRCAPRHLPNWCGSTIPPSARCSAKAQSSASAAHALCAMC